VQPLDDRALPGDPHAGNITITSTQQHAER
jgi:hypothetical protein